MTIKEHNRQCGCIPQDPCGVLAAILREQHAGGFIEVIYEGGHPRAWVRE